MKAPSKLTLGVLLTTISVLALVIAFVQVAPLYEPHFSMLCGDVILQADPNSRIAYCITVWPPQPDVRGGNCCVGVTDQDEIHLGLVILGCGIWLFRQAKKEQNQESNGTIAAG